MNGANVLSQDLSMCRATIRILLLFCILSYSCEYNHLEQIKPSSGANTCAPPDTVSFAKDIVPIFTNNCALIGCHSGTTPQSSLDLEASVAYAQLMRKGTGYVNTQNPGSSIVYNSLVTTNPANKMPQNGKLDDCSINLVLQWIQQGAKNN